MNIRYLTVWQRHCAVVKGVVVSTIMAFSWAPLQAVELSEPIKIGFHAPLTGFAAADGKSARLGAELAIEQINAQGGIQGRKVEMVTYDDGGKPEEGVQIANRLITQDKVAIAVSGSHSGPSRAAATAFQRARIPYVAAYAIEPNITKAGDFIFRTTFVGDVQGRAGAKLIGENLGKKKVVILKLNNDFGVALSNGFKEVAAKFGITIVGEYSFAMADRQFGPLISSVKHDQPEAIYATGYYFNAGPLISQLRAAGVKVPIIGQEGYDGQSFIEIAGKSAEGVIITTSLNRDSTAPQVINFIEDFENKKKQPVDMVAASTYTAFMVSAAALRKVPSLEGEKLRDALIVTNLVTPTGTISFNSLHEVRKAVQNQIVKNGRWRFHSVIDDPVLLAPPEK